jgi:hypothetical protein
MAPGILPNLLSGFSAQLAVHLSIVALADHGHVDGIGIKSVHGAEFADIDAIIRKRKISL